MSRTPLTNPPPGLDGKGGIRGPPLDWGGGRPYSPPPPPPLTWFPCPPQGVGGGQLGEHRGEYTEETNSRYNQQEEGNLLSPRRKDKFPGGDHTESSVIRWRNGGRGWVVVQPN